MFKRTLTFQYLYWIKDMSIFDSFKIFRDKSVDVVCPKCSRIGQQHMYKLRKKMAMVCPHCGHYFRSGED